MHASCWVTRNPLAQWKQGTALPCIWRDPVTRWCKSHRAGRIAGPS